MSPGSRWVCVGTMLLTFSVFLLLSYLPHLRSLTTSPVSHYSTLRIMPLGDSITEGYGSSDYNGYRLFLHQELSAHRCVREKLEFIGSQKSGVSPVDQNEGYSGADLETMLTAHHDGWMQSLVHQRPHVVLLHIGTSDMSPLRRADQATPVEAPPKLDELIREILHLSPSVTLLVAQIVSSPNPGWNDNSPAYNDAILGIAAKYREKGFKIAVVDMRRIGAECIRQFDGSMKECKDLIEDGVHPTDEGYRKMAEEWESGLVSAHELGWLRI